MIVAVVTLVKVVTLDKVGSIVTVVTAMPVVEEGISLTVVTGVTVVIAVRDFVKQLSMLHPTSFSDHII